MPGSAPLIRSSMTLDHWSMTAMKGGRLTVEYRMSDRTPRVRASSG